MDPHLRSKEIERRHHFDDTRNPKVMKSDLRNNDEVVIHHPTRTERNVHPYGTFPKWEATVQLCKGVTIRYSLTIKNERNFILCRE